MSAPASAIPRTGRISAPALEEWPDDDATPIVRWRRAATPEPPRAAIVIAVRDMGPHIGAAIASALAQTVPFELVIRDDASRDDTVARAREALAVNVEAGAATAITLLAGGVHRGLSLGFALAARATTARWIFNFDGDDVSAPERVARTLAALAAEPEARIAYARCVNGHDLAALPDFARVAAGEHGSGWVQPDCRVGATLAVDRVVLECFGPLRAGVLAHDAHLRARALLLGGELTVGALLVKRLVHPLSISETLLAEPTPARLAARHHDARQRLIDIVATAPIAPDWAAATNTGFRHEVANQLAGWYALLARRGAPAAADLALGRALWRYLPQPWRGPLFEARLRLPRAFAALDRARARGRRGARPVRAGDRGPK